MASRGGVARAVVPLRGVIVFLAIVVVLALVVFLAEREVQFMSARGMLPSEQWEEENRRIALENYRKIKASPRRPLVESTGFVPAGPSANRRRILIIGDSFVWGDGVTNLNMTWWRQLQWELERRGYAGVDVLAAGLNGASTQDQFGWLADGLLDETKPDAIVFGYVTNDPQMKGPDGEDLVRQYVPPEGVTSRPKSAWREAFPGIAYLLQQRRAAKRTANIGPDQGYPYGLWELKLLEGENFRQYGELLDRLAGFLKGTGLPHAFVTTPLACERAPYDARHEPVRARFAQAGIPFHDLVPRFIEYCAKANAGRAGLSVNPVNGHPGAQAAHFIAVEVANLIEQRFPAALGHKSVASPGRLPEVNDWMPVAEAPVRPRPGEWTFAFPFDRRRWLNMPVGLPHILLSFDRPVPLRSVRVSAQGASGIRVWASTLDPAEGFEEREPRVLGRIEGERGSLDVPANLREARFTSLRIAIPEAGTPYVEVATLDAAKIGHGGGHAYVHALPALESEASNSGAPMRSQLVLLEDGRPLPRPNAVHEDVRRLGAGRFSHWQHELIFSTLDGSDPRINGRRYVLARSQSLQVTVAVEPEGRSGKR